jgi:hypothetical protein
MQQEEMKYFEEMISRSIQLTEELIHKINVILAKLDDIVADKNLPVPAKKKAEKKFVNYYSIIQDQFID